MWFKILKKKPKGPANLLVKDFLAGKEAGDTFTAQEVADYAGNWLDISIAQIRAALNRHNWVEGVPNTKPMQYRKRHLI